MKTRAAVTLGLSALVLGGALTGVTSQHGSFAFAGSRSESNDEKQALKEADKARKALANGKTAAAIVSAEAAVGLRPQVTNYRVLLGQSYLKAGRFGSAREAFADAMTLEPGNGKAALNLVLSQIATGDWAGARKTLDAHADIIAVSDRGLAMALAGDPAGAVDVLIAATRSPEADAKTRQNLALSLALAGRWQDARTVVAVDLAPGDIDKRILQWAAFSRPKSASDQVAALLGVTPVQDPGQPVALALNASVAPAVAVAKAIEAFMPQAPAEAAAVQPEAATAVSTAAPAPAPAPAVATLSASNIQFGPRQEIVQTLPASVASAASTKAPSVVVAKSATVAGASAAPRTLAKGSFFVQVGAYENAAVAKDAWGRATRRYATFSGQTPQGMNISSAAGNFYRLSVGGFARADAAALCRRYKAQGGDCFVRAGAGEKVAFWATGNRKLASR
jgi:Flp pilus assembly protein TadD